MLGVGILLKLLKSKVRSVCMQNLAKRSFDLITHSILGSMWLKLASVIRNTTGIHLPFFSSMFQSMCSVLAMCLQGGGSFSGAMWRYSFSSCIVSTSCFVTDFLSI